jgi:hypothetical protein
MNKYRLFNVAAIAIIADKGGLFTRKPQRDNKKDLTG